MGWKGNEADRHVPAASEFSQQRKRSLPKNGDAAASCWNIRGQPGAKHTACDSFFACGWTDSMPRFELSTRPPAVRGGASGDSVFQIPRAYTALGLWSGVIPSRRKPARNFRSSCCFFARSGTVPADQSQNSCSSGYQRALMRPAPTGANFCCKKGRRGAGSQGIRRQNRKSELQTPEAEALRKTESTANIHRTGVESLSWPSRMHWLRIES